MKREGIRKRQKVFLTFLLVVIIGILPTVEVWAQTFQIDEANRTDGNPGKQFIVKINGQNITSANVGGTDTDNNDLIFYVMPNDVISTTEWDGNVDKNGKTSFVDALNAPLALATGASKPLWTTNTLLVPGSTTYSALGATQGWKVTAHCVCSSGSLWDITSMKLTPVDVLQIKYMDGTTEISDAVNTNTKVFPKVAAGGAAFEVNLNAISKGAGFNFDAWYTDAGFTSDKITAIRADYDVATTTGILLASDSLGDFQEPFTANAADGYYYLYANFTTGGVTPPAPAPDPEPKPDPYKITYYPDNVLNFPKEEETYDSEIGLPKNTFRANPGQMFEGWQVADTEQDSIVGTGEIYKPGTVFQVKDGMAFIAVWKDNPTFKIESDEEYFLTPPENTINKLTSLIRMSSEITYYEDGEEPEEGDTEKEKKTYIKGTAIPSSQLEVVIDDPKAIRKVGTFPAKIVYKGLYNRTIEKTVSVTVLDPNAPTYDSFSITDVTKVGTVTIDYPSSIAYHGDKWDKAKSLVKVTDETTKVIKKKVKNSDLTGLKPGDSGKFNSIKLKVKENKKIGINKKESGKLTKKVNHRIKAEMKKNPKTITIRSLIVMPELINNVSASGDKLKSVSLVLDDKTMVTIKEDSFTIDEEKQVVNFTGNYGGNLTFEELGLIVPTPSSVPVPSNVPVNK